MAIMDELLKRVPVGEENAVTGRLIWQQIGMWSASSIKHQLHRMAAQGLIRSKRATRGRSEINLYFRSPE
jgi:hypothetical protein